MSVSFPSEDSLFAFIMGLSQAAFPGQDMGDKGFLGLLARADARKIMLLLRAVEQADDDSVPAYKQDSDGTVLSKNSTAALDAWAITFGLPLGTAGVYGRRGAIGSSGGAGVPSCTVAGTNIPAGSQATDPTGLITVQTTAAIVTNGPPNTLPVGLVSVTTGAAANLPINTILTWSAPPPNVGATFVLTTALSGASDRETDGALLARILFRLQNVPRGGTAADYRYWAEASTDATRNNISNGIARAHVYPLRSGLGSVDVLPLIAGSGTGRIPAAAIIAAVLAYLNTVRPVTASVNVLTATGVSLRIRVRPRPFDKYAYDWADTFIQTAIVAINAGAKTISCVMLPALKAAVDAGGSPRIQVIDSAAGASAKPYQARVLSYVAGAPDVMTVDSWPFPAGPVAGTDYFWAGGPVVDTIATNLLAYVDQLGPSRQSGFADPNDVWESDCTLARITDVTMEARDTDGTRMVRDIPNLITTGVLVAVGAGAFAANSYTTKDVLGVVELAYLRAGGIEVVSG